MQGRHIRLHLRNHYGFDSENIKAMNEFGLTAAHVSTAIGGTFTRDMHLKWVQERREIEANEEKAQEA